MARPASRIVLSEEERKQLEAMRTRPKREPLRGTGAYHLERSARLQQQGDRPGTEYTRGPDKQVAGTL